METFYARLKTRLGLENFSGLGAEAMRQDVFSAINFCGLESLLTDSLARWSEGLEPAVPSVPTQVGAPRSGLATFVLVH